VSLYGLVGWLVGELDGVLVCACVPLERGSVELEEK